MFVAQPLSGAGPRACVLKADGTNCEDETAFALALVGARPQIVPMNALRGGEERLADYDLLVVPGGFSYGDDVGAGTVMAVELTSVLADELGAFAAAGKPIAGICNGFQVLVRTGLLPFGALGDVSAALAQNAVGRYECRWVDLVPDAASVSPLVRSLPARLALPLAHGEGRFVASEATLDRLEAEGLVALRYADAGGHPTADYPANPNGAERAIAGVTDPSGRIIGLMPHPERFVARHQHPSWRTHVDPDGEPDGLTFLRALVALS